MSLCLSICLNQWSVAGMFVDMAGMFPACSVLPGNPQKATASLHGASCVLVYSVQLP